MKKLIVLLIIINAIFIMALYNYHNKTLIMESIINGRCEVIRGEVYCNY